MLFLVWVRIYRTVRHFGVAVWHGHRHHSLAGRFNMIQSTGTKQQLDIAQTISQFMAPGRPGQTLVWRIPQHMQHPQCPRTVMQAPCHCGAKLSLRPPGRQPFPEQLMICLACPWRKQSSQSTSAATDGLVTSLSGIRGRITRRSTRWS